SLSALAEKAARRAAEAAGAAPSITAGAARSSARSPMPPSSTDAADPQLAKLLDATQALLPTLETTAAGSPLSKQTPKSAGTASGSADRAPQNPLTALITAFTQVTSFLKPGVESRLAEAVGALLMARALPSLSRLGQGQSPGSQAPWDKTERKDKER